MNIELQPGRYIVAVSGGVDSVVLLHLLHANFQDNKADYQFIVAHFDHGIRDDSAEDCHFVRKLAAGYSMPFVYDEGVLGKDASEEAARSARYKFLQTVRDKARATAIITAHHEDDVIETALLNLLRGTGRKGVSSLQSTDVLVRPLLHVPKTEIKNYAKTHKLQWREDATNTDTRYKRNYVRHKVAAKLTQTQRQQFTELISNTKKLNTQIDEELTEFLRTQPAKDVLRRGEFLHLPHALALECMAAWLRQNKVTSYDKKGLQRMVVQAKTLSDGQQIDANSKYFIAVSKKYLTFTPRHH